MARMYRPLSSLRFACVAFLGAAAALAGCSAGDPGAGGGNGANSGSGSSGNGSGGNGFTIDDGEGGSGNGNGKYCQDFAVDFTPQTPTVFVLVDQSGSIYDLNQWIPLRDAVLPVIQELQADVRIGFGSYTGTQAMCTGVNALGTTALNNYDAIAAFYNALPTTNLGGQETPTALAIEQASKILLDDPEAIGAKAILWVTGDDDSDFCDNPDPACGNDAAIAAMQIAFAKGVSTFPLVLDSATSSPFSFPAWLDYWAQAGLGESPNWPSAIDPNGPIRNCSNQPLVALRTANGRAANETAGRYSAEGGTATAFVNADASAIAEQLRSRISGLKSCVFDLTGTDVKLKESGVNGDIKVNDVLIPREEWTNTATSLTLLGAACETWKDPNVTQFFAGFPCEAFVK